MKKYPDAILEKLAALEKKYAKMGQDMPSYLDGLLYANILTYWDYIHLDTLLSIQQPKTDFKDEFIFISYHQITELMFGLIIHELKSLLEQAQLQVEIWQKHLSRIIRYYRHLIGSFDIMIKGMDKDEFKKFRMALLPASGFQSVQYRQIELYATGLAQLVNHEVRADNAEEAPLKALYEQLYWKQGNRELKSGNKTLTLKMFEEKYDYQLYRLAKRLREKNLYACYLSADQAFRENAHIIKLLREFDLNANLYWPLAHYHAAAHHLKDKYEVLVATGGTNWQTYLPPHQQKVLFFPEVWNTKERADWGR